MDNAINKKHLNNQQQRDKQEESNQEAIKNLVASDSTKIKLLNINHYTTLISELRDNNFEKESSSLRRNNLKYFIKNFNEINALINNDNNEEVDSYLTEEDKILYNLKQDDTPQKPIKNFWLIALKNSKYFKVNKKDEKVLLYLKKVIMNLKEDYSSIKVTYVFEENEYMNKKELSKIYFYDKDILTKTESDKIIWKDNNSNPTLTLKKSKKTNEEKYVSQDSFFDMFDSDKNDLENEDGEANFIFESLFPNVFEYYMNFKIEDNEKDEDEYDY